MLSVERGALEPGSGSVRRDICDVRVQCIPSTIGVIVFVPSRLLLVSLPRSAAAICAAERVFLAISNRTICEAGHTETESARANAPGRAVGKAMGWHGCVGNEALADNGGKDWQ